MPRARKMASSGFGRCWSNPTPNPDEPEPKRRLSVVTVEIVEDVEFVCDYNGFNERSDTTTLTFCRFAQDFRFKGLKWR